MDILLYFFTFICIGLLIWGFSRKERVYQYPFFMGFTFTSFILPQAIGLVLNPGSAPQQAVQQVLIMSSLCALMCWLGYQIPIPIAWIKRPVRRFSTKRLNVGAAVYIGIGLFFWSLIYSRPELTVVSQQWSGIVTLYLLFANLLNIGFTIVLLETIKRPRLFNGLLLLASMGMLLYRAFLSGRRTTMGFVVFSIAVAIYFARGRTISRKIVLVSIFLAALIIVSIAQYRFFLITGDWSTFRSINPIENLQALISQEGTGKTLELRNAALVIDSVAQSGRYELGAGYWDVLIFRWVPAQLLGSEFKSNLQLNLGLDYKAVWSEVYGYKYPTGSTVTGIGDSFAQFDYFGCLVFCLFAFLFKYLWYRAVYCKDLLSQLAYILLITSAMTALTHQTANFFPDAIYYCLFSLPLLWLSQRPLRLG